MGALATRDEPTSIVQTDAASLMEVISRAANDPNTDVDKLERLLALYERITDRTAKAAYNAALALMQPQLPVITERGEIKNNAGAVQSTYAKWEDINDAIKPILASHGFGLSFRTGRAEGGITVTGVLSHSAGHSEETTITLPIDASGSKNNVQGVGSSTSYGKRYTAGALLNLTSRGEDDDGQRGGMSAALEAGMAAINMLEGRQDFLDWKKNNAELLASGLPQAEANALVRQFNTRFNKLREREREGAPS